MPCCGFLCGALPFQPMPPRPLYGLRVALVLGLLGLAVTTTAPRAQTVRYVSTSGTNAGACTDPASPCRTVAYALGQAMNGDTLQVAAGIYTEDGGLTFDRSVFVRGAGRDATILQEAETDTTANARLARVSAGVQVTITRVTLRHGRDGQGTGGAAVLNEGTLVLDDVRVMRNGLAPGARGPGGAIRNRAAAHLTVRDTEIAENQTAFGYRGGGLYNEGTAVIESGMIRANRITGGGMGGDGGGIYNAAGATLALANSVVVQNTASSYTLTSGAADGRGGGVYNAGTATVRDSEVRANWAGVNCCGDYGGHGGGLYNVGLLTIEGSLVTENRTRDARSAVGAGGGIYSEYGGSLVLRATTVSGNRTGNSLCTGGYAVPGGHGGGLFSSGSLVVEDALFEDNETGHGGPCGSWGGDGGGLYIGGYLPGTITRTTIRGNRTGAGTGAYGNGGGGGGIAVGFGSRLTLSASTISDNETGAGAGGSAGGGLYNGGYKVRILNTTFSGNRSWRRVDNPRGGTLYTRTGLELVAITITRSGRVPGSPPADPAFAYQVSGPDPPPVRLSGTLIAGNEGEDCRTDGPLDSDGYNFIGAVGAGNSSCAGAFPPGAPNANNDYVGTEAAPLDPMLGPLANNGGPTETHALLAGSLAINHGTCTGLDGQPLPADQRGYVRVPPCDIGAYEFGAMPNAGEPSIPTEALALSLAGPNPLRAGTTLALTLQAASPVRVAVYDARGREVAHLLSGHQPVGPHALAFDASGLPPGVYFVRASTQAGSVTRALTVLR